MKFEGYLEKQSGEKYWAVVMPMFGVFTQGKTKKEAYFMAKDAIEFLVDKKGFEVQISEGPANRFYISANKISPLIGLLLKQKRLERGLTIIEIANRLGSKSPTAYSRYESGKVQPSFEKLDEILKAMGDDLEPIIRVG